ncbi:MAG: MATE family efflux transporter [Oscillospiraceae bacterium]|jgi:putative MATE family efflux protein|nr:MATE family efflux transporter [Oscillospiraceae bacterium]
MKLLTNFKEYTALFQKFKSLFGTQNMSLGNPLSVMLRFSIPLLIGNIAQLFYNTADAIIVGKMISADALGAVGASAPIQQLFFVFFMTVGTGVSVMVAQFYGAGDKERLSSCVGTSLVLTLIATVSITVLGVPLAGPILKATGLIDTGVANDLYHLARSFLIITFIGATGQGFYNILSGILRGMGESVFPLIVLLGTSLLNVALAILFVSLGWGVAGSAWATAIANAVSAIILLARIRKLRDIISLTRATVRLSKKMAGQILRIGVPSGIMQVVLATSYIFVQRLINGIFVVNSLGVATNAIFIAANTAVTKVDGFANLPSQAFSMAGSTFAGQNIGAGKFDRVSSGFKISFSLCMGTALLLLAIIYIWGGDMLTLFIDMSKPDSAQIIALGVRVQRIMVWCYPIMAVVQACNGVIRGAGDTMPVMWFTLIATVVFRVPMAYIMVLSTKSAEYPGGNPDGIFWSMVICFGLCAAMCAVYYRSGKWKDKAVVRRK